MNPAEFTIQPISRHVDLTTFDCGTPALNDYLQKYARQNHNRNIGKTFLALGKDGKEILGYYTASASEIDTETLPETHSKHLPRYPVPAMRIGRLAVDKSHQGQGIGAELLWDAFRRAINVSNEIGIYAVAVDAKDAKASAFYLKYGFIPLTHKPLAFFLPIETIKVLFAKFL